MIYPKVMDEFATLEAAIRGKSLARYGDGELRLAVGADSVSQRERSPELRRELMMILKDPDERCLVCIPNIDSATPKKVNWERYARVQYVRLYDPKKTYGSAFITRPDSAPWIDTPGYWSRVKDLWKGKTVVLVTGNDKSLSLDLLKDAKSVRLIRGPETNAYSSLSKIESQIGRTKEPILICLGAAATCLAWRLAKKGMHGLDLGHIGMMMRHQGKWHNQTDARRIDDIKRNLGRTSGPDLVKVP